MRGSEEDPGAGQGSASYDEEPERSAELRHVRAGERDIVVARYAGYCYGVERALRLTGRRSRARRRPWPRSGPIIHNPSVVGSLEDRGVDVVDDVDDAAAGTLIVRTHGVLAGRDRARRARGTSTWSTPRARSSPWRSARPRRCARPATPW